MDASRFLLPVLGLGGTGAGAEQSRWRVQARGTGVVVYYLLSSSFAVGLGGAYERRDIRLSPDDRLSGGVLRERRLPIGLELAWRRGECAALALSAGASLYNTIRLRDRDGNEVVDVTTDPAPYLQLELSLHF